MQLKSLFCTWNQPSFDSLIWIVKVYHVICWQILLFPLISQNCAHFKFNSIEWMTNAIIKALITLLFAIIVRLNLLLTILNSNVKIRDLNLLSNPHIYFNPNKILKRVFLHKNRKDSRQQFTVHKLFIINEL